MALGDRVQCKHIVLKHFSMKYPLDHELVAAAIPDALRERVRVFL
jgi:hypothetical protein